MVELPNCQPGVSTNNYPSLRDRVVVTWRFFNNQASAPASANVLNVTVSARKFLVTMV